MLHSLAGRLYVTSYNAMTRATVFRIIGIGFLAMAALGIYRGEYGVGRTGGVVVTRAHDPVDFWQGITIQVGVGCALLYLSRSAGSRNIAPRSAVDDHAPEGKAAEGVPGLPNYDPAFCGKVVKTAAYICIGLIVAELVVLLFVHPSDNRCPGWILHPGQRSAASLWLLTGMFTVLPALWISNVALRWENHYARKTYDSITNGPPTQFPLDLNQLLLIVAAGWCLFGAIPLVLMLGQCTPLYDYLNAFH